MKFAEVETLEEAKRYLLGCQEVKREALHMLCLQLGTRDELVAFIREHDIKLTGNPGR